MENITSSCEIKFYKAEVPLLTVTATIANLVALITQIRMLKSLRSKNLWLLIFLTSNDLFMSVNLLIDVIINTITCDQFHNNKLCEIFGWFGISSFGVSIFLILIINVERFLMIVFPIYHHKHVTTAKLVIALSFGEFTILTFFGLPFVGVGSPYVYYNNNKLCTFNLSAWETGNQTHAVLILFIGLYITAIVLLVLAVNIATIYKLNRRNSTIQKQTHRSGQSMENTLKMAKKFSLLTKVVALVNSVCTLPFFIKLIFDYINHDTTLEGIDDTVTTMLLFLTPIINPFLYLFFNRMYRQYLFSPLRRIIPCLKNKIAPAQGQTTNTNGIHDLQTSHV